MLYHREVYLPNNILNALEGEFKIIYGIHAIKQARVKYGLRGQDLPSSAQTTIANIIEVEIIGNRIVKIVVRLPFDNRDDICVPLIPQSPGELFAKTMWLNSRSDRHRTLDKAKYAVA
jgi:subtilisin-like proprotein convertase family protein